MHEPRLSGSVYIYNGYNTSPQRQNTDPDAIPVATLCQSYLLANANSHPLFATCWYIFGNP